VKLIKLIINAMMHLELPHEWEDTAD